MEGSANRARGFRRRARHVNFQKGKRIERIGKWLVGEVSSIRTRREVLMSHNPIPIPTPGSRLSTQERSEGETTTDSRSKVVVGVIGDAGAMRNGDGQTAAHPGIRNSCKTVEALGEVMIHV